MSVARQNNIFTNKLALVHVLFLKPTAKQAQVSACGHITGYKKLVVKDNFQPQCSGHKWNLHSLLVGINLYVVYGALISN